MRRTSRLIESGWWDKDAMQKHWVGNTTQEGAAHAGFSKDDSGQSLAVQRATPLAVRNPDTWERTFCRMWR